jgi:C4-dicarboxylate transporter, DctM subunit
MTPELAGVAGIGALFALLAIRIPIWAALALVGFFGNYLLAGPRAAFAIASTTPFDVASGYTLSVIPLFVLMGEVASRTGLSADLFIAAQSMLARVRGGLAVATISASACFGAVCGSSVATAATMTRIALPEMRKAGYHDGLAAASVASGGTLGILIPPSIILVIYAAIAEESVPRLFAAGLIPGIALTGLYILAVLILVRMKPELAPNTAPALVQERKASFSGPWQFLTLFVVTIGGIYAGIFSPTEAAAIGAFGAILLGVLRRRLNFASFMPVIESAVITSCTAVRDHHRRDAFLLFHRADAPADGARRRRPRTRTVRHRRNAADRDRLSDYGLLPRRHRHDPDYGAGVPADGVQFGYDPIWFAIVVVIVVEVGLITPPVGMNLFIIQAQAPEIKIPTIYRGIIPVPAGSADPDRLIAALSADRPVAAESALWLVRNESSTRMSKNVLILDTYARGIRGASERRISRRFFLPARTFAEAGDPSKFDILIAFGIAINDQMIASMTRLQWIQSLATGVDHFLRCASLRPEVLLTSMRGIHGPAMRETVAFLMLSASHDTPRLARQQAERRWDRSTPWPLLCGKTAAIVGVGISGTAIANLLKAFGMRVIGLSRTPRTVEGFDEVVEVSRLNKVAAEADYLINVLPGDAHNHNLIGRSVFDAMKPSAYFINVGRGETVDEQR